MKATVENIGQTYKIRVNTYKSFRHYGGRDITTFTHIVDATLVGLQDGYQPYIVTLNDKLESFPKGHKIAICDNVFEIN